MTYNQVQSFQINDYANHYVDIEITGYRTLYSKRIGGRGVAGLISWLGTAGPVDCFNKSVSDCYIRVYRSFWQGTANFWLGLLLAMPLKQGTQLIFKILEVYLRDHTCQLEYSKHVQYSIIETYYRFVFISFIIHFEANLLEVATKNNLRSSAREFYHR